MAKDTTSPFTPGRPVPFEFFVGRIEEIERLHRKIRDSLAATRVEVAFVTGERGIGKSSLASFARFLGERDRSVVGIHALLGGVDTVEGAVKRVFDQLLKEQATGTYFEKVKELFSKNIKKVGLFGNTVEFDASAPELRSLADHFGDALRGLLSKFEKTGFVLILDDINGLAQSRTFADWFKSLVDGISVSKGKGKFPLAVILVGLEERRRAMIESQPSVARIFDVVEIRPWTEGETRDFFSKTFQKAEMTCSQEAVDYMTRYAGGLPVLAHEIGDAAFAADNDGAIGMDDAMSGTLAAADRVGSRYLDPVVYRSMRSLRYRAILRRMARELSHQQFTRSSVRGSLPEAERKVFDNFLGKMKRLGVVVEDPEGGRGAYKFGTSLHYLYFFLEAVRAEKADS